MTNILHKLTFKIYLHNSLNIHCNIPEFIELFLTQSFCKKVSYIKLSWYIMNINFRIRIKTFYKMSFDFDMFPSLNFDMFLP